MLYRGMVMVFVKQADYELNQEEAVHCRQENYQLTLIVMIVESQSLSKSRRHNFNQNDLLSKTSKIEVILIERQHTKHAVFFPEDPHIMTIIVHIQKF